MSLWIRVDASTSRDPAVAAFAGDLGVSIPTAVGHLVMLWGVMAEHTPDGIVRAVGVRTLEQWAGWTGKKDRFGTAFIARFVSDGVVHGWANRQGALMQRMERDRARHRKETSAEIPRNTRGDSTSTQRNVTERKKREKKKPSPAPDGAEPTESFPVVIYDWLYKRHWFLLFGWVAPVTFRTGVKSLLQSGLRPGQIARGMHGYMAELEEAKRAKDGKFSWFLENVTRHIAESDKAGVEVFPEALRTSVFGRSEAQLAEIIAEHYARLAAFDAGLLARVLAGDDPPVELPAVELAA